MPEIAKFGKETMRNLLLILSFFLSLSAFGQSIPDSLGFTDKAEARNKTMDGLKEGKWLEYYETHNQIPFDTSKAKLYRLCVYVDGNLYGKVWWYYKSGKLESEDYYKNGKENGLRKDYYENGNIKMEDSIKDWERNGLCKKYRSNGKLEFTYFYINDRLRTLKEYDLDGQTLMVETPYNDHSNIVNVKNGVKKHYSKNGNVEEETPYTNDTINGIAKEYYTSEKLKSEYQYTKGKENGVAKEYYESGRIKNELKFVDDTISSAVYYYENGKEIKNGILKDYWQNGKLESKTIIKNGKALATKNYDENGNEIK